MRWWQVAMMVGVFVAVDIAVIGAIFSLVSAQLRELAAKFPPRPARPDAVWRRYQSFRFGMSNFGKCIHVGVDEECLHLVPATLARWFGARPMSIPWDAITPGARMGAMLRATIAGTEILGPAWCLELARPDPQQPAS